MDCSLESILNISMGELLLESIGKNKTFASCYSSVLFNYLNNNVKSIEDNILEMGKLSFCPQILLEISRIRLKILKKNISEENLLNLKDIQSPDEILEGERNFVLALGYDVLGNYGASKEHYLYAYKSFSKTTINKKALLSLFNAIVTESWIHPESHQFNDYFQLIERAKKNNDLKIAGLSYLNISREYQNLGSPLLALKYSDLSLSCLEREEIGTQHYELAVIHRCHVLIDLHRMEEAYLESEKLQFSKFEEVMSARQVLLQRLSGKFSPGELRLTPTWKERLETFQKGSETNEPLTSGESQLLELISKGAKSKHELIQELYPKEDNFFQLEDRFKNLLMRLRKKLGGKIILVDGKYQINDLCFLSKVK